MNLLNKLLASSLLLLLGGCAGNDLSLYSDTTPKADINEYFNGKVKAWGIVQDWKGRVVRRFDVDMIGECKDDQCILKEDFTFYDGETDQRTWYITKLADGQYEGKASDIIDKALGSTNGSAIRWNYVMDLPVDNTTYRIRFDDWMWVMNDGVLINRSYLKKFGFVVSEITIFMKKQD